MRAALLRLRACLRNASTSPRVILLQTMMGSVLEEMDTFSFLKTVPALAALSNRQRDELGSTPAHHL